MEPVITNTQVAQGAIVTLLQHLGEDVSRDGLKDTPARVVKAWLEMTAGYKADPAEILGREFEQDFDEMVVLKKIIFHSSCEHHMLPFYGEASVGYIPNGKVVGISKLSRLVECFARRLQIQERMAQQIAKAVMEHLGAQGVGVSIKAHHLCMGCRGVRQPQTEMVTNVKLGLMREDGKSWGEFLRMIE